MNRRKNGGIFAKAWRERRQILKSGSHPRQAAIRFFAEVRILRSQSVASTSPQTAPPGLIVGLQALLILHFLSQSASADKAIPSPPGASRKGEDAAVVLSDLEGQGPKGGEAGPAFAFAFAYALLFPLNLCAGGLVETRK